MMQLSIGQEIWVIPESSSPCDLWKSYYNQLLRTVGKRHARTLWLLTWEQNGSTTCTMSPEFNAWLQKKGIDVSNASTRAIADLSAMGDNLLGMGKNITKVIAIGTPVILGGIALAFLIVSLNSARHAQLSDVVALHPAGRKLKHLKGL